MDNHENTKVHQVLYRDLATVDQLLVRFKFLKPGGLRWDIFHSKQNGLDVALIRKGRRILVDVEKFFDWLEKQSK